jgi:hypothetical protein
MTGNELNTQGGYNESTRRTIRRTAIALGLLAFGWYSGFMALRLL